jgi:hypothetical protein
MKTCQERRAIVGKRHSGVGVLADVQETQGTVAASLRQALNVCDFAPAQRTGAVVQHRKRLGRIR